MHKKMFLKIWLMLVMSAGLLLLAPASHVFALPEIEGVPSGNAEIVNIDNYTMQINASDKAIVNYKSFDIAQGESVIINLPSVDSEILNRVLGNSYSSIFGNLTCNGIFILVNEKGIFFGPSANIDVAGLVASTRDITNADFLSSKYNFQRLSNEQLDTLLLNQGKINIRKGGFGVLIAGAVENSGTIICPLGTIALAGGDMVRLDIAGNGLISVAIDKATAEQVYDYQGKPVTDQLKNTGTLQADGGMVLLKAESLPGIFEKAINLEGYVKADKLEGHDGTVKLVTSGKVVVNAEVTATRIVIGDTDEAVPEAIEMPSGTLTAEEKVTVVAQKLEVKSLSPLTEVYKTGDLSLTRSRLEDNLITLEGEDFKVTYLKDNNLTLQTDNTINTKEGVIIQANQVKVIAKQFGTTEVPLTIEANLTYINRIQGNIDILESIGLGSTVMLRGPPDGFGAIIYNKETNLILEAEKVRLIKAEPTYFYGNITFYNFECTTPAKEIYFEAGKTYTFRGSLNITGFNSPDGIGSYYLKLRSQTPGSRYIIGIQTENLTLDRVDVRDCQMQEYLFIERGTDSGNNLNLKIDPVWDGGSTVDNNWSTVANWENDTIPAVGSDVSFGGTGSYDDDSTIDSGFTNTIATLTINSTYDGTITIGTGASLTVSGAFTIHGGAFNSNGQSLTVGSYTQDGGTFTAGASTITCNGNFSVTAGTYNANTSTITLDATNGDILFTGGGYTFNNVTFKNTSSSNDRTITLYTGTFAFNGNFTLYTTGTKTITVDAATNNPSITISGNLSMTRTLIENNPFTNPGFESGTTGWTNDGQPVQIISDGAHGGTYSLDIVSYQDDDWSELYQTFASTEATYLTLWVKGSVENVDSLIIYIKDSGGSWRELRDFSGKSYESWTQISLDISSYSPVTGVKIYGDNDSADYSDMLLDDFSTTIDSGTATIYAGSGTWKVAGNVDFSNITFYANTSTLEFNKSSGTQTLNTNSQNLNNLKHSDAGILQLSSNLSVGGTLINSAGTFDTNGKTVTVTGLVTVSGGTYQAKTSTQTFNGGLTVSNTGTFTCSSGTVTTTTLTVSGGTFNASSGTVTTTTLTVSGGTFNASSGAITATALNVSSGTFAASSGTVTTSGLTISGTGIFTGSTGTVDVNGNVSISGGTLTAPSGSFTVSGNWERTSGTFTPGTYTVTFDGTASGKTITSSSSSFYNLTISGTGGVWTLQDALSVSNALTVSAGTLTHGANTISTASFTQSGGTFTGGSSSITISGYFDLSGGTFTSTSGTLSVGGDWNDWGSGTFTHNSGTIDFTKASGTQYLYTLGNQTYYNLSHSGAGTLQLSYIALYKKQITIDKSMVSNTNQTDFPVLIYRVSDSDLAANAQADTDDIVFTDASGTLLAYEIEKYNSSTGELWAWVKVPTLSASANTTLYMYYGNSSCSSRQNAAGVWSSNYAGVWHLPNGTTLTALDSTSNDNDGTIYSVTATTGQIDGAGSFSGGTYIGCGTGSSLDITGSFTLELWAKRSSITGSWQWLIAKDRNPNPAGYLLGFTESSTLYFTVAGSYDTVTSATFTNTSSWYHIVATHTSGTQKIYVNGVEQTLSSGGSWSVNPSVSGNELRIGALSFSDQRFSGIIDEARVSNTNRSADWVKTSYNNQNNPAGYETFGSQTNSTSTITVAGNWSNSGTFTAGTSTVTFNGSATQTLNPGSSSFYNLTIDNGSSGGVQLVTNNLTVSNNLTINSGKLLDLAGKNLTTTGATFTNSGTLQLQGGETLTGFSNDTANNGTVKYTGATSYPSLAAGNTYKNLTFASTGTGSWTCNNATLTVSGTLNISNTSSTLILGGLDTTLNNTSGSFTNYGTLQLEGDETLTAFTNDTSHSGTVKYTGTISYTGLKAGNSYYNLTFASTGSGYWTLNNNLTVNNALTVTAGTLDVGDDKTITVTGTFTINGTISADTAITITATNLTMGASGSISNSGGNITINGSGAYILGNISTVESIDIGQTTSPSSISCLLGTEIVSSGPINLKASGDITLADIQAGANPIVVTSTGGSIYGNNSDVIGQSDGGDNVTFSAAAGEDIGLATENKNLLVNASTLTIADSNSHPNICITNSHDDDVTLTVGAMTNTSATNIDYNKTLTLGALTISGGALTIGSTYAPSTLNINAAISTTSQNITITASKITFGSSGSITTNSSGDVSLTSEGASNTLRTITSAGALNLSKLTTSATYTVSGYTLAAASFTINSGATLTFSGANNSLNISGGLTINSGAIINAGSSAISVGRSWANNAGVNGFSAGTSTVTFNGSAGQTISGTNTWYNLYINNTYASPSDTYDVDPSAAQTVTNTLTVNDGQWTPYTGDSYKDVVINANGIMNPDASANISISGNWTNSGTFSHNSSTVTFTGGSGDKTITSNSQSFYNVTFNDSDTTWTLQDALAIAGDLTLTQGTLNANGKGMTISGDFSNSGTYTHGNNTVTFNGSGASTISGSTTFYNFTCTTAGKTLSFAAGTTQTIAGTLTLRGTQNNLLGLTGNNTWYLYPQGTLNIDYLSVTNCYNLGEMIYNTNSNFTNCFGFALLRYSEVEEAVKSNQTVTPSQETILLALVVIPQYIGSMLSENISIGNGEGVIAVLNLGLYQEVINQQQVVVKEKTRSGKEVIWIRLLNGSKKKNKLTGAE